MFVEGEVAGVVVESQASQGPAWFRAGMIEPGDCAKRVQIALAEAIPVAKPGSSMLPSVVSLVTNAYLTAWAQGGIVP